MAQIKELKVKAYTVEALLWDGVDFSALHEFCPNEWYRGTDGTVEIFDEEKADWTELPKDNFVVKWPGVLRVLSPQEVEDRFEEAP